MKQIFAVATVVLAFCSGAMGQMLRYDQHREIEPPEYATIRLGPFYSDISFSQTAGFRYSRSQGTGTDFLFGRNRGVIKKDGSEYPLISTLDARNYVMISRHTDLDISFSVGYAAYPMGTQQDEFFFDIAEEGVSGSLSMEFYISKFVRGKIFDNIKYKTDYIDVRGAIDNYGGAAYEHLDNTLGVQADWLMNEGRSLGMSFSRFDEIVMSDEFKAQERVALQEDISYEQQLAAFLVGGARAGWSQTEYKSVGRSASSSQSYSLYSTARLTAMTTAGASVGYSIGGSDDLSGGNVSSVAGSASLTTMLSPEMSHGIVFSRGVTEGFSGPFDITTAASYNLSYKKERADVKFVSQYSTVEPQVELLNKYSSWVTSLSAALPLTRFMGLIFNADYSLRENGDITDPSVDDPEYSSNYETWSARLGTSFSVTRKIVFELYGQHVARLSDEADLQYSRDIVAGTFTFSHSF